jgi:acetate kinase
MKPAILAVNAGSSSIKFALDEIGAGDVVTTIAAGQIEGIGTAPHFIAKDAGGHILAEQRWPDAKADHETLLSTLLDWVEAHLGDEDLIAVGHRVVHGGAQYFGPVLLTPGVIAELAALTPLAPLHQPHNLSPVRAIAVLRPKLPQIACFDTAFHHDMPAVAARFALPRDYAAEGVRRYGFHGLSFDHIAVMLRKQEPSLAAGRVIVAHLGNGCSLCAMQDGRSIDVTTGFTALDGLVMGTRCGDLDPGVILYMLQHRHLDAAAIEHLLYNESGLLGVSGISSDMRALLDSPAVEAVEAVELFVYRIGREAGGLASALGGIDGFVFTAGIGENAAPIRAAACARLAWLGVELDAAANERGDGVISTQASRVRVLVIPADEEATIVRDVLAILRGKRGLITGTVIPVDGGQHLLA